MDWFRLYHRAPTDPKWLTIARRADAKPGEVWAIFTALLDHASQHEDRGSIEGFDAESIAGFYGFEERTVAAILDALIAKGIVAGDRIACWEKRQPKREDDTAAERKRRQRQRHRDGATPAPDHAMSRTVTPDHAPSRQRREEEIREEGGPPLTPPNSSNGDLVVLPTDLALPGEWRVAAEAQRSGKPGADLDEQWQRFKNRAGVARRDWLDWRGRWLNWALEARTAAGTAATNGHAPASGDPPAETGDGLERPSDWLKYPQKWRAAAVQWAKNTGWASRLGPAPGEAGCLMPSALAAWASDQRAAGLRRQTSMLLPVRGGAGTAGAENAEPRKRAAR